MEENEHKENFKEIDNIRIYQMEVVELRYNNCTEKFISGVKHQTRLSRTKDQ